MIWTPRIKFGGLLDIPDEAGETRAQTPIMGMAVDLLSEPNPELKILNIENSIVKGRVPANPGEILIGEKLAKNLNILPGDLATLISSTMYKSMTMKNFKIVGTVLFGMTALDRGSVIVDIADIQNLLDMQNAVGEILGFSADDIYHHDKSERIAHVFNAQYADINDQFTPVMGTLRAQSGIADLLDMVNRFSGAIVMIFLVVMSIVLWNAGLMGSIRRYGEIGIRLAIGEEKGHIYRSMIIESIAIGLFGSVIGTAMGLALSYYMQINGISIDTFMKDTTLLISNVMRARVTPTSFVIGFLPGVLATMLGTCIAGIGIYKRQTSQLFKELEV
jgi:putative ABC transport system permease protein